MQDGTMQDGTMQDGTMQDCTMQDGTMQDCTMQDCTMRHRLMQCCFHSAGAVRLLCGCCAGAVRVLGPGRRGLFASEWPGARLLADAARPC
jgi:hypothetical protein